MRGMARTFPPRSLEREMKFIRHRLQLQIGGRLSCPICNRRGSNHQPTWPRPIREGHARWRYAMKRKLLGTMLILGGMLSAARADTWVFTDTLRPNGHERSMAAKRVDFRRCGADRGARSVDNATAPNLQQCMRARLGARSHRFRFPVAPRYARQDQVVRRMSRPGWR